MMLVIVRRQIYPALILNIQLDFRRPLDKLLIYWNRGVKKCCQSYCMVLEGWVNVEPHIQWLNFREYRFTSKINTTAKLKSAKIHSWIFFQFFGHGKYCGRLNWKY